MSKKIKAAARDLATIAAEIVETFWDESGAITKRGGLLLEAKAQLKHGQWLSWLDENFSMSARAAQNAMAAARFVAKYEPDALLMHALKQRSPGALYILSAKNRDNIYTPAAMAAILEAAKTKPVD